MTHLKLLTALTALVLLTACGGASPTATGDPAQTTDCAANPFGASCIAEGINVEARITDCITAGNAGDAKCTSLTSDATMNTEINTCLTNPFDDSCTASDFTFSTYADMARVNRVSFCGISGNAGNALCTALTTCQANPFATGCGAYFESSKNPYCETNPTEAPCVNTADLPTYPATPDATTRKNEFLAATATGFADGATNGIMIGAPPTIPLAPPNVVTVKFADADTATGGAALFGGELYSGEAGSETGTGNDFYYAGILAGTNLGAPITETITTAVRWTGDFRVVAFDGDFTENIVSNFGVNITFDGAKGTVNTDFAVGTVGTAFSIDGDFDANGIITGTVAYGQATEAGGNVVRNYPHHFYSPGTLSGIIGQNGVVGVFHSDNANVEAGSTATPYSGGFVAAPPVVNTAAWLGSFTGGEALPTTPDIATQAPTRKNQFLQGTTTGFADGANTNIRETFGVQRQDIAIQTLTFANTDTATGGVAFFGGALYNSGENTGTHFYYAGILAGTNLGAPITETITSAKWMGKIRAISNVGEAQRTAADDADIELDITFDATRETKGTMTTFLKTVSTSAYSIDGTFDDKGIISGDIYFGYTTGEGASEVIDTDGALYSPGTLSGIIGQNGAVGVFHSDNGNPEAGQNAPSYSGGFVVTPPE